MMWLAHFVSASGEKKSFGKPCWDKSMRTAGIGSVGFLRDAEQATRNAAAIYPITPRVGSFIGNVIIYREAVSLQVPVMAYPTNQELSTSADEELQSARSGSMNSRYSIFLAKDQRHADNNRA